MGIRDRFRAAFGWVRAYGLSSRGRYEEALRLIQFINTAPTGPRAYWSLFEIYQLSLLRRHVETLRSAIAFVDQYAAKQSLSANERYFVSFAKWAGAEAFYQLFPATAPPAKLEQDFLGRTGAHNNLRSTPSRDLTSAPGGYGAEPRAPTYERIALTRHPSTGSGRRRSDDRYLSKRRNSLVRATLSLSKRRVALGVKATSPSPLPGAAHSASIAP